MLSLLVIYNQWSLNELGGLIAKRIANNDLKDDVI
jgi:hypothetical protein